MRHRTSGIGGSRSVAAPQQDYMLQHTPDRHCRMLRSRVYAGFLQDSKSDPEIF